jgi:hypothetical protein
MAHVYDPVALSAPPNPHTRPFNRVHKDLMGMTPDGKERNVLGQYDQIDNGRLPVFDAMPSVVGSATSGQFLGRERYISPNPTPGLVEGLDTIPWGQLVFDYFTAIPFSPCPNASDFSDSTCGRDYPPIDQSGLRVRGRININTAPWNVLAGLPMLPVGDFPPAYQADIDAALAVQPKPGVLGEEIAKNIVAYREGRKSWETGLAPDAYYADRDPYGSGAGVAAYRPRRGYGFLSVGELLNVRHPDFGPTARLDAGAVDPDDVLMTDLGARFEYAVANLVALDDWATTRSHVFTVYGVIRGAHWPLADPTAPDVPGEPTNAQKLASFREADQKAIRFQSTVDRLPMLFGERQPVRIGSRMMGGLVDERGE